MTRLGQWCAIAGAAIGIVTLATWNLGDSESETVAPATTDSATTEPAAGAALDGQQLFQLKGCSRCHLGPDTTPYLNGFPPLDDAASWAGERKPDLTAEEYLTESMLSPGAFISPMWSGSNNGTQGMPSLILTEEEVDALVAYLLGR
ncbi:MAG TPA: cytochrome c [Ilumatobacteraceae bacterium]|nr:cytochrome c [Ilumatobacteraceae bacterium]